VAVDVGTAAGGRALFDLPALPAASGEQQLQRTLETMQSVTSYRLHEELSAGLGESVRATYAFAAPNSFEGRVVQNGTTFETVWIGDARYTRQDDDAWKIERGSPAVPVPTYIWDSFEPYQDVRIVGAATVDGRQTTEVAFAGGDEDLPTWFKLWVDDEGYVRRAEMRAPGHFMDHRYYDFNTLITIEPPKGATK
jgi:hypothetical protein